MLGSYQNRSGRSKHVQHSSVKEHWCPPHMEELEVVRSKEVECPMFSLVP